MKRLARFLKKYRFQVIAGPVFKLIEAIFELIVPLVMADMIDVGVAQGNIQYIWQRGGVLLLLGVVGLASSLTCQTLASRASQGVGTDLRRELFHHINTLSYRELDHFGTPSLITRMTGDINQMQTAVAMLIRLVVRAPFLVIGAVVMAMRIDLELSLVFLAIVPMLSAALYIVMSRSVPFYRLIQRKLDRVSLITRENLSGARVVRAFRKQAEEEKRFEVDRQMLLPRVLASPQEAFYADKIKVPIREAAGHISGEFVMAYPPGIPILAPGEEITDEIIDYIQYSVEKGCSMQGMEDSTLQTLNVLRM